MRRWLFSRHARSDSILLVSLVIGIQSVECMEPVGIFLKIALEMQELFKEQSDEGERQKEMTLE